MDGCVAGRPDSRASLTRKWVFTLLKGCVYVEIYISGVLQKICIFEIYILGDFLFSRRRAALARVGGQEVVRGAAEGLGTARERVAVAARGGCVRGGGAIDGRAVPRVHDAPRPAQPVHIYVYNNSVGVL